MGKKIVVYYCKKCPRIKRFDGWVFPDAEVKREIQEQRINGYIKFIAKVCPECSETEVLV